jgi:two-component system, OmpR family, phosphate regulon sensor histidine kinase PhoR
LSNSPNDLRVDAGTQSRYGGSAPHAHRLTFPAFKTLPLIPRTLATRLALTYTCLALLIMACLGWSLAGTVRDFYLARVEDDLLDETIVAADALAPLLATGASSDQIDAEADRLGQALNARLSVVAEDGAVLGDSERDPPLLENYGGRPEVQAAFRSGIGASQRATASTSPPYFFVARSIAGGAAVVRLGIPLAVIDGLVRDIQRQVVTAALLAAVLMTAAGWFVARRIAQSLAEIGGQAAAVAAGHLDASVEPAPTQELGDLGRAFNAMTAQLRGTVAELERVRVRLEATLANLSDGVIITDARGHVALANEAAASMLAVRGLVTDEPFVEVARDHELAEMVRDALSGSKRATDRLIRHSRSGRLLQCAARRLDTADESIGVVVLRDITELRRLEGVRRDFVANVSHELRTPLTSIRALVETLESGAIDDASVATDFLARIISEVDRLAALVGELLDLARLESGRIRLSLEKVAPEALLRRAAERMSPQTERARLTLQITVAPSTPPVVVDRGRIDQVLLNLIHNAVKFTPAGGAIDVLASAAEEFVEFRVKDTGVGVSPDELPRLFERFYKADRARRSQGTGLGLAIAKHIVQAHGGTIWAEANQDRGTSFVFRLPIAGPASSEPGDLIDSVGLPSIGPTANDGWSGDRAHLGARLPAH